MAKVKKAGCILLNPEEKTIALVLRKQTEYSFPKGHVEEGESLVECAIRETAEETKRDCEILIPEPIYIEEYVTPGGDDYDKMNGRAFVRNGDYVFEFSMSNSDNPITKEQYQDLVKIIKTVKFK